MRELLRLALDAFKAGMRQATVRGDDPASRRGQADSPGGLDRRCVLSVRLADHPSPDLDDHSGLSRAADARSPFGTIEYQRTIARRESRAGDFHGWVHSDELLKSHGPEVFTEGRCGILRWRRRDDPMGPEGAALVVAVRLPEVPPRACVPHRLRPNKSWSGV